MSKIFSYKKREKLKSKKLIEQLFAQGKSFVVHPIKITFMSVENAFEKSNIQVGVGVSKRNFKNATDRNRIKRLIRESYRLNKIALHEHLKNTNNQIAIFLFYVDNELPQFHTLQAKMKTIIDKLINQFD
ncbi:MAG: ribonuclease P protein component [Chitinophagales bacterium]|nr:ribonuclease P protein component [Chitinophagales bacterium]